MTYNLVSLPRNDNEIGRLREGGKKKKEEKKTPRQAQLKRSKGISNGKMSPSPPCYFNLIVWSSEELGSLGEEPLIAALEMLRRIARGAELVCFFPVELHSEKCQI